MIAPASHSLLRRGMSLCAVFRPSLTPVRSLTMTGISPSALFIPMRIFPSRPAASSTSRTPKFSLVFTQLSRRLWMRLTRGPAASFVYKVDWAATIDIDEVEVARALPADDLGGGDKKLWLAARDLHAKNGL